MVARLVLLSAVLLVAAFLAVPGLANSSMLASTDSGHPLTTEARSALSGPGIDVASRSKAVPSLPGVLATVSTCTGETALGSPPTFCFPSGPVAVAYDSVDHLVIISNDRNCFGCTDYLLAYNDSTGNVSWCYVTGTGLSGQEPYAITYFAASDTLYVSETGSSNISVVDARNGTPVSTIPIGSPGAGVYDPHTRYLYVVDGSNDSIATINTTSNSVVGYWSYAEPFTDLTYDSGVKELFASSSGADAVYAIDTSTGKVLHTISTGSWPAGLYYYASGDQVFVAEEVADEVGVIDDSTMKLTTSITGVGAAAAFAYDSANGSLYVIDTSSNRLPQIDPATDALVHDIALNFDNYVYGPDPIVYDPTSGDLYFAATDFLFVAPSSGYQTQAPVEESPYSSFYVATLHELFVADGNGCDLIPVNTVTLEVGDPFYAGCNEMGVTFDAANGDLYVANFGTETVYGGVTAVNETTHKVVGSWLVGWDVGGVAFDPDENELFVGDYYNISVLFTTNDTWVWSVFSGPVLNPNQTSIPLIWASSTDRVYAAVAATVVEFDPKNLDVLATSDSMRGALQGLAFDPRMNEIFAAQYGDQVGITDNVSVLNATTLSSLKVLTPCGGPSAIAYDSTVNRVYVTCTPDQQIAEINPAKNTVTGVLGWSDGGMPYLEAVQDGLLAIVGGNGYITILSPAGTVYALEFSESGLPFDATWTVEWKDTKATAPLADLWFLSTNVTGKYVVSGPAGFNATPATGKAKIDGANMVVDVTFTAAASPPVAPEIPKGSSSPMILERSLGTLPPAPACRVRSVHERPDGF